jgi:hypothetical protein
MPVTEREEARMRPRRCDSAERDARARCSVGAGCSKRVDPSASIVDPRTTHLERERPLGTAALGATVERVFSDAGVSEEELTGLFDLRQPLDE